ncbi:MAG: hypothetical protein ACE145_20770 [Terriglobia bacterium]
MNLRFTLDETVYDLFLEAARRNGTNARDLLLQFVSDYVSSNGHPNNKPGRRGSMRSQLGGCSTKGSGSCRGGRPGQVTKQCEQQRRK